MCLRTLFLGLTLFASYGVFAFDAEMCNYDAAYEVGYNDGQITAKAMDSKFLGPCRKDLKAQAQKGYREGFQKGRAEIA